MDRPLHPWLVQLRKEFGEHPDYEKVRKKLLDKTGHETTAESLRLVAQGHRRPGPDLSVAIWQAWPHKTISVQGLLTWEHYSRQPGERVAS